MAASRPPAPWQSWTAEQWDAYAARQAAACERPGWEKWAEMTGRNLVEFGRRNAALVRQGLRAG